MAPDPRTQWTPVLLLGLGAFCLALSAVGAHDRLTWVLEVFPILLAVPVLVLTRRRFPLTSLAYVLIFVHALVLMVGGHYTYERVPLGFWLQRALHLRRNDYDRLGHFAQGFVPAVLAREVLLRRSPLRTGKWLFFLVTCVCLAISACYKFVEWWTAVLTGDSATAFLGTQGDPWDTQWDMFLALVGAITAQLTLARVHDRQLDRLRRSEEHTSELQSHHDLVCRLLLEKKKTTKLCGGNDRASPAMSARRPQACVGSGKRRYQRPCGLKWHESPLRGEVAQHHKPTADRD